MASTRSFGFLGSTRPSALPTSCPGLSQHESSGGHRGYFGAGGEGSEFKSPILKTSIFLETKGFQGGTLCWSPRSHCLEPRTRKMTQKTTAKWLFPSLRWELAPEHLCGSCLLGPSRGTDKKWETRDDMGVLPPHPINQPPVGGARAKSAVVAGCASTFRLSC